MGHFIVLEARRRSVVEAIDAQNGRYEQKCDQNEAIMLGVSVEIP
jgi:hypothetical protein